MSTRLLSIAVLIGTLTACRDRSTTPTSATVAEPAPAQSLDTIAERRASLRSAFQATATGDARRAVRGEAAAFLERALIDTVLPRWDGTPWAFSGTSTAPRAGSIACGYFVSTTLREAGLRVERSKLAQQPSEDIIKTLVPPAAIARFSDVPVEKFVAAVAARGDGLYVVGLDIHVGFLVVRNGEVLFHHASYVEPRQVVREEARRSAPLVGSRYRVIGKLLTDDALIDAWLLDRPVATKTRARPRSPRMGISCDAPCFRSAVPGPRAGAGHGTSGRRRRVGVRRVGPALLPSQRRAGRERRRRLHACEHGQRDARRMRRRVRDVVAHGAWELLEGEHPRGAAVAGHVHGDPDLPAHRRRIQCRLSNSHVSSTR